jgi:hypothetical protein
MLASDDGLYAMRREVLRLHWDWWELRRATGGGVTATLAWPLFAARQRARDALYELREAKRERGRDAA